MNLVSRFPPFPTVSGKPEKGNGNDRLLKVCLSPFPRFYILRETPFGKPSSSFLREVKTTKYNTYLTNISYNKKILGNQVHLYLLNLTTLLKD
jgi:hypothetical protein